MKDPIIKSEVEKMQKSMLKMEDVIKEREALQRRKVRLIKK